jgi:hypothetical protein
MSISTKTETPKAWLRRMAIPAAVSIAAAVVAALITMALGVDPGDADIKYDWLSARAAIDSNAYTDIITLGENEGVDLIVNFPVGAERPFPHPRTPGAILLSLPLLLFDFSQLFALSVATTVGLACFLGLVLTERFPAKQRLLTLLLLAASAPLLTTLRFAGQAMIVAFLVVLGWALYRRGHDKAGTILIAIAGVLKIFPLVLVLPMLLARRFRAAGALVAWAFGLTLVGLMLPGVSIGDAINAMSQSGEVWFSLPPNGSVAAVISALGLDMWTSVAIASMLGIGLLILAVAGWRQRALADPLPWLLVALLTLPVSWVSYDLVLVAGLFGAFWHSERAQRLTAISSWGIWIGMSLAFFSSNMFLPGQSIDMGLPTVLMRLFLFGAWCLTWVELDLRLDRLDSKPMGSSAPVPAVAER